MQKNQQSNNIRQVSDTLTNHTRQMKFWSKFCYYMQFKVAFMVDKLDIVA